IGGDIRCRPEPVCLARRRQSMSECKCVGLKPWLPWPLTGPWWTEPVRAERLAALRIGLGAVLLLDILVTYLPRTADFFGSDSLGSAEVYAAEWSLWPLKWSPLAGIDDVRIW